MPERALIIDDEESMRFFLEKTLARLGFAVESAADGRAGLARLKEGGPFDLVLLDLKMPRLDGMELLELWGPKKGDAAVVMMTAYGDIKTAVQAVKRGAADFLTKPFDTAEIETVIDQVLARRRLERENRRLKHLLFGRTSFGALVGQAPAMRLIYQAIERIADADVSVLIFGESGTGKELVARELHARSARSGGPFVAINASALPEHLLESELFGYLPGAFTGAVRAKTGLFTQAHRGTLFLDEIGDMPRALQPKILRVLEERRVQPLGATEGQEVDFRLISATNQNLLARIEEGRFRADLFFRLNVVPLVLPALRDRPEDLPLLAAYFFEKHARSDGPAGPAPLRFAADALDALSRYHWPGNVRELEHLIARLLHLGSGPEIRAEDLPTTMSAAGGLVVAPSGASADALMGALRAGGGPPPAYRAALARFDRAYLHALLSATAGNVSRAAELAGISRPNLHRRIRDSGLDADRYRRG